MDTLLLDCPASAGTQSSHCLFTSPRQPRAQLQNLVPRQCSHRPVSGAGRNGGKGWKWKGIPHREACDPHLVKVLAQDFNDHLSPLPPPVAPWKFRLMGSVQRWPPALETGPCTLTSGRALWPTRVGAAVLLKPRALVLWPSCGRRGPHAGQCSPDPGGYRRGDNLAPSSLRQVMLSPRHVAFFFGKNKWMNE